MKCILLAGGVPRPHEPLYTLTQGRPKALLEVAGRPLGQWVVDGLTEAERIDGIIVVGLPTESFHSAKIVAQTETRGDLVDNLLAGIDLLRRVEPGATSACVATSDDPLAAGPMFDGFIDRAGSAQVTGGVIRRETLEAHYPDYPNTYWHLADGDFTGADFAVFDPRIAGPDAAGKLSRFAAARKSTLRMAWLVGPGLLIRYLLHRLTVPEAAWRLGRSTGLAIDLLEVPWPELGLDVDMPEHLSVLEDALHLK